MLCAPCTTQRHRLHHLHTAGRSHPSVSARRGPFRLPLSRLPSANLQPPQYLRQSASIGQQTLHAAARCCAGSRVACFLSLYSLRSPALSSAVTPIFPASSFCVPSSSPSGSVALAVTAQLADVGESWPSPRLKSQDRDCGHQGDCQCMKRDRGAPHHAGDSCEASFL